MLAAFLPALAEFRFAWLAGTVLLFALGDNFYPYFYPHYVAALTCAFLLVAVTAVERVGRWSPLAARLVLYLCAAHFVFWYGMHCGSEPLLMTAGRYDAGDFINYGDPEGRRPHQPGIGRNGGPETGIRALRPTAHVPRMDPKRRGHRFRRRGLGG